MCSFRDGVAVLALAAAGAFLLNVFVLGAVRIPSRSMEGTLLRGDYVLVNKLVHGAKTPSPLRFVNAGFPLFRLPALRTVERGDVVVFEFPTTATSPVPAAEGATMTTTGSAASGAGSSRPYFVKRCMALSGDEIELAGSGEGRLLLVNGTRTAVPPEETSAAGGRFLGDDLGPVRIPRAGDLVRLDPRTRPLWEDIVRKDGHLLSGSFSSGIRIDGKPAGGAYRAEQNYLFVVGDNAADSYDSRSWGLLPEANVVGEAMLVYWSVSPSSSPAVRWERVGRLVH